MTKHSKLLGFISIVMLCVMLTSLPTFAVEKTGDCKRVQLFIDGKVFFGCEGYLIDNVTYVPLRKLCESLGSKEISYCEENRTAYVTFKDRTIEVTTDEKYITVNGRCFYTVGKIKNINDSLYVPLRALAKALGYSAEWNSFLPSVSLKKVNRTLESAEKVYREDEVFWLARIIEAEAGGEVLEGKIAVGNVVLNRVADERYPNTIWGVIFDFEHGIQFTPAYTGTVYNTPSEESIAAAKMCLEGYEVIPCALFFLNPRIATSNWITENRPFAIRIGNHDFYY